MTEMRDPSGSESSSAAPDYLTKDASSFFSRSARAVADAAAACNCAACSTGVQHASDCAVHNEPAHPNGPCDCGASPPESSSFRDLLGASVDTDSRNPDGRNPGGLDG